MTTKTTELKSGYKVTIKIERSVNDKILYADGYNIPSGREVYENTEITLTDPNGKYVTRAREINALYPKISKQDKEHMQNGAVARIDFAYMNQETYDIVSKLLAEVDAETPKSDEYIALETAKAEAEKIANEHYQKEQEEYRRNIANGMCPKCGTWCYGDCEAN